MDKAAQQRDVGSPNIGTGTLRFWLASHRSLRLVRLYLLWLLLLLVASVFVASTARADPAPPQSVVSDFNKALLRVMCDGQRSDFQARYKVLASTMDVAFDFQGMTAVALGSAWPRLGSQQRTAVVTAFRRFSIATYVAAFDNYAGERFVITGHKELPQGTVITAQLVDTHEHKVTFGYLLHDVDGSWRIVDIYLDGTISQLAVRRSEFTSMMARSGPEGIVKRLRELADNLEHDQRVAADPQSIWR